MTQRRSTRLYAATLAIATALFATFAAAVLFWEDADHLDIRFVNWVRRTAPEALVQTMEILTYAGSVVILGPLAITAGILLNRRGRTSAAWFVVAAFVGSQVLGQALKAVFQRGRPEFEDPFVQLTTYAFPSGHAFGAAATYGALALVLASTGGRGRRAALLIGTAVIVVVVVAASRVIVGRHFLFDVSAGVAGGIALLSALLLILQRARRPSLHLDLFAGNEEPQRAGVDP